MNPDAGEIQRALSGMLRPEQIADVKVNGQKVLVTVAAEVPMAEKPAFAEKVKHRAKTVSGVQDVFVSFKSSPSRGHAAGPAAPTPLAGVRHIVAVGAGKGGVGKSTVAVNLAVALARLGRRVGLLDADIYGPSAAIMTGTQNHRARGDSQQRVLPAKTHGISVISVAFLLPEEQAAIVWRGPMVGKMVSQLLMGVAWGELDELVVDLPPGTGDAVLSLAQTVPLSGAVVVTTPQDVALIDVLKAVEMFRSVKVPVLGVVENMSGFVCPHCGAETPIFLEGAGKRAAERCDLPLLGSLPLDPTIPPGGDTGEPIVSSSPQSDAAKAFTKIAGALAETLDRGGDRGPGLDLTWSG